MTRSISSILFLCSLVTMGGLGLAGADKSDAVWTHFVSPRDGEELIGEIVLEAEVLAMEPIRDVVFFVDGRPVGQLTSAPYRMRHDLGEENRPHTFEVVATDITGRQARHRVMSTPVPVGDEYEVELQQLYVTVTRDGKRVLDLEQDDFTILDEGKAEELVTFARGNVPFTAVLLIDSSASMYGSKLEAAQAGATAFIRGMHELDQGKVIVYSDVVQNATSFSGLQEVLIAGLIGATGQGGTAVNDNLYAALKLLESRQGRRLVVLLSDGIDTHSVLDGVDVLDHARRSQAMVYWMRLLKADESADSVEEHDMASAWRTPADYRRQTASLVELVELSGGRIIPARTPNEIEEVFTEILLELREQYALGYYPTGQRNDGSWRRVKVKIDRKGVKVRTHAGYIDL
jgi:Ca-activated chloride channel family protein